jgi:hypothetical protein
MPFRFPGKITGDALLAVVICLMGMLFETQRTAITEC